MNEIIYDSSDIFEPSRYELECLFETIYQPQTPNDDFVMQSEDNKWSQVSKISDDIYLGGIPNPKNDSLDTKESNSYYAPHSIISKYNIGVIISFTDQPIEWNINTTDKDKPNYVDSYLHYVIKDSSTTPIDGCFEKVISIIKRAKRLRLNIFIHCHAGISRSATCLIAYYLAIYGIRKIGSSPSSTIIEIIEKIRQTRPYIMPNIGFLRQLLRYEKYLRSQI
jgi:protein-tyrosine phosphatase